MVHQRPLDLDRADILAAGDDDVLGAVGNLDRSVRVLDRQILGMEIPAGKGLFGGFGVLEIPFHHGVAAHDDFALGLGIARHLTHAVVHDGHVFHHREGDTLTGLDRGLFVIRQAVPLAVPDAFGDMAVGFGQPVDLLDVESQFADRRQCRRGGGCACGEDLDRVIESPAVLGFGVDDHVQHDGRAAEMRHALIGDGVVDILRGDVAAADHGAAQGGHHPCVVPAVAVEQRYDLKVAHEERQFPADRCSHRHQVGAAMVIDHALGPPSGAGCVIEGETFPFVLGQHPAEIGITRRQKLFVILLLSDGRDTRLFVRHLDHEGGRTAHLADRLHRHRQELAVDQCDLRLAVIEDIGHGVHIQPRVDGVQHRTAGGHAEGGFGLRGHVGQDRGHHIAGGHACLRQRRCQPRHAPVVAPVGQPCLAIDQRLAVGKDQGGALQVRQWCQRYIVGRPLAQPGFIAHPAHVIPPSLLADIRAEKPVI